MNLARRILWHLYAWPVTLLVLFGNLLGSVHKSGTALLPYSVFDSFFSLPALLILHLYVWDKKLFPPALWKIYALAYLAWDFSYNLIIQPALRGVAFNPVSLMVPCILLPFYYALFRCAFRRWPAAEPAD